MTQNQLNPGSGNDAPDGQQYGTQPGQYGQGGQYYQYGQNGQYGQSGQYNQYGQYGQQTPYAQYNQQNDQANQRRYGGPYGQYHQPYNPAYGAPTNGYPQQKSRSAAGILGILLGTFGVHNFYLGQTGLGVAQLLITLLSFGLLSWVSAIWGIIEGVLYLTSHDQRWSTDARGVPLSG